MGVDARPPIHKNELLELISICPYQENSNMVPKCKICQYNGDPSQPLANLEVRQASLTKWDCVQSGLLLLSLHQMLPNKVGDKTLATSQCLFARALGLSQCIVMTLVQRGPKRNLLPMTPMNWDRPLLAHDSIACSIGVIVLGVNIAVTSLWIKLFLQLLS